MLRLKSYYELGDLENARAALTLFMDLHSEPPLKKEALDYLVKIEEKENELREKKFAEQRKAEELRLAQERKLAEEKRQREEETLRSYQAAMTGDITAIRSFLSTYPLWAYAGAGVKYQTYEDGTDSYKLAGEKPWQVYPEFGLKARLGKVVILKVGVQLIKDKPAFQVGIGF